MSQKITFTNQFELYQALSSNNQAVQGRAFDYIYQEIFGSFSNWVYKNNGSTIDAEDAFQQGLLNFYLNLKSNKYIYQEGTKITTIVFQYAKMVWINELNSGRLKTKTQMPDFYDETDVEPIPQEQLERLEIIKFVNKCLEELKEDCLKVVKWFYIEEFSIKEIAEKLGMQETSTKQKRYDCTQKLKSIYLKYKNHLL
jgi:RNA polymerase sigma factor (sigma-70 family)